MTNPIPPGLDRSPMGQWAKATRRKEHYIPEGFEGFYIYETRFSRIGSSVQTVIAKPDVFPYIALAPIGDTETEARLRWEADMMARHGETVQGVEGNPWIGWAVAMPHVHITDHDGVWASVDKREFGVYQYHHTDLKFERRTKIAFFRPGDKAREADLRAQLNPDLDPTREGSGRVLEITAAPAPERVERALQVGTPETWEEHVARRECLFLRRLVRLPDTDAEATEPPQHPLTTPPDKTPTLDIFWRRG